MFELLLQADKSFAAGLLDQAERTYWQLIELDPTNAIALAGLARVSLKRGDERLARTFADQALSLDPDSISARKVIRALQHDESVPDNPGPAELPLRAAERLEAMSRRRAAQQGADDRPTESGPPDAANARARNRASAPRPAAPPEPHPAVGPDTSRKGRPDLARDGTESTDGAASSRQRRRGSARPSGGAGRTNPPEPLPGEPLRERRRSGRLAAAAAAAAAAAGEPAHPRHEPHRAMPSGRRFFEPGPLRARPEDPFAAAEMAAAVAAVDAIDDSLELTGPVEVPADRAVALAAEAAEAAEADESVALRISFLPEAEAAREFDQVPETAERPEPEAPGTAKSAAAYASVDAVDEVTAVGVPTGETVAAVEFESLAEAPAGAPAADPARAEATDTGAVLADRSDLHDEGMSERDAEIQALREAVAIVMADTELEDAEAASADTVEAAAAEPTDAGAADDRAEQAAAAAKTEPAADGTAAPTVTGAPAEASADAPTPQRKKGLFRRFRGN